MLRASGLSVEVSFGVALSEPALPVVQAIRATLLARATTNKLEISDAVDGCGKLRYEAMVALALLGDDSKAR
jgi:hypothetical protein